MLIVSRQRSKAVSPARSFAPGNLTPSPAVARIAVPTDTTQLSLRRRAASEAIGTAFLLAAVVGSGIMGDRLAGGNVAIALLANTLATGAALVALILTFGPISGAHFNPAVSLADASEGGLSVRELSAYVPAQLI